MKTVAVTSEQMLETVLYRLQTTGWARVDFDRLVRTYLDFRTAARRCVYGIASGPNMLSELRCFLERDIVSLESEAKACRTIGRVWLTPLGLREAAWLKLEQARYGTLLLAAAKNFPPLAAVRP